ncbi:MAG: hypothetical protein ACO1NO_12630 [Burkholderiaceae bacterium]
MFIYLVGIVEETTGRLMHNSRRQVRGYQKKLTGKAILALGDAHRALQRCINASIPEPEENLRAAEKPIRQTSKL